jgi:hypothetical protein
MTSSGGRLTCPRCGANNFDTVTSCWKCGTALTGAAAVSTPQPAPAMSPNRSEASGYLPAAVGASGDPAVARRAAFWLAVVFPWFGLPIGWTFMMMDDYRRQAIGRLCATWSLIALIFHLLFLFASTQLLIARILPYLAQQAQGLGRGASGGMGGDFDGMRGGMP